MFAGLQKDIAKSTRWVKSWCTQCKPRITIIARRKTGFAYDDTILVLKKSLKTMLEPFFCLPSQ